MKAQTTGRPPISWADQTAYQAMACSRLANILSTAAEQSLPPILWTIARIGCGLHAQISLVDVGNPRAVHQQWVQALGLTPQRALPGYLTATARVDGVQVTVITNTITRKDDSA